MTELDRMVAERACEKLTYAYANRLDAYDHDGFMQLWAEGAVLDMLGRQYKGHSAIRGWLEARENDLVCRHLVTNVIVDAVDESNAKGVCYTIAYRARGWRGREPGPLEPPPFLVEYETEFRKDGERGWLFARRAVKAALIGVEQLAGLQAGKGLQVHNKAG